MSTFGGLFAAKAFDVPFVVDRSHMKIETKVGTSTSAPPGPATIVVSKIKNPSHVDSYGPFKISVFDRYRKLIAEVSQPVQFKTTPGALRDIKVSASGLFIDEEIRLGVSFVPIHDL